LPERSQFCNTCAMKLRTSDLPNRGASNVRDLEELLFDRAVLDRPKLILLMCVGLYYEVRSTSLHAIYAFGGVTYQCFCPCWRLLVRLNPAKFYVFYRHLFRIPLKIG
jgi:hypothetical protein